MNPPRRDYSRRSYIATMFAAAIAVPALIVSFLAWRSPQPAPPAEPAPQSATLEVAAATSYYYPNGGEFPAGPPPAYDVAYKAEHCQGWEQWMNSQGAAPTGSGLF